MSRSMVGLILVQLEQSMVWRLVASNREQGVYHGEHRGVHRDEHRGVHRGVHRDEHHGGCVHQDRDVKHQR